MTAIPFAVACLVGAAATFGARRIALAIRFVNQPNPIVPQHRKPIAYLGGAGVYLGTVAGLLVSHALGVDPRSGDPSPVAFAIGGALFLGLGTADDLRPLAPLPKLLAQALVAALCVALGLGPPVSGVAALDAVLSWLWIVAVVNAFNLTDVCDGLVGGLAVVSLGLGALLHGGGGGLVVAGACAGFLVFNRPPASIFLGDGGSHLLGFAAATIIAPLGPPGPLRALRVFGMALAVGVPLFELVFLIAVRRRKGLRFWKGSPDHFSLRLQAAGLSKWGTDAIAWTAAALLVVAARALEALTVPAGVVLIAALLVAACLVARLLLRWEVR